MLLNPHDLDLFNAVPYPMVEETVYSYLVLGLYNPPVLSFSAGMGTRDEALLVVLRFYELESCTPGEFGAGCDFERQSGHRVTRKDVRDFLNAHPYGVSDYKDTFERFLRTRYGRGGGGGASGTSYRPAAQPERPITYRATPSYRPASPTQASQSASGGQQSAGRATPAYRPAPPSQSGPSSGQTSIAQPTARPTPIYRPAPPSQRPTESRSDASSRDQQTAPAFRPTPSYRPAPPSDAAQTVETSGQAADRAETPPVTPPPTPKYRPAPPSPSSRNGGDGTKPPYRPMSVQADPAYPPRPASAGTAAAIPFGPAFRGHAVPEADGGEETSILQRVLPTVIRVVCIASLVFLFLERRLTDQWLGLILLIAGIVFAKDLAEKWSVERLTVCGILLLLFLSGHLLRWWVLSAILVLIFFYFH